MPTFDDVTGRRLVFLTYCNVVLSSHWGFYCSSGTAYGRRHLWARRARFFGGIWMFSVDSSGTVCRSKTSRTKRLAPSVVWNIFAVIASGMSFVGSSGTDHSRRRLRAKRLASSVVLEHLLRYRSGHAAVDDFCGPVGSYFVLRF